MNYDGPPEGLYGSVITRHQDLYWTSHAPDSLLKGYPHKFVDNNVLTHVLSNSSNGYDVTTTDNGISFVQPHWIFYAAARTEMASTIPLGGSAPLYVSGHVQISATDVLAGRKTFTLALYDDDVFYNDLLQSVFVTVPTAIGIAGMYTYFRATATLSNEDHIVVGPAGSSGEQSAEVFYVLPDGTLSNTTTAIAD
jgi:hypothetical protein